jgi:hypothetical protein
VDRGSILIWTGFENLNLIARLILTFGFIIAYVIQAVALGQIAENRLGRGILWTLAFFFLPIASHCLFAFLVIMVSIQMNRIRTGQNILEIKSKPVLGLGGGPIENFDGVSITPFDSPVIEERVRESKSWILDELRDHRIDDLIDSEQWGKAHSLAKDRLFESQQRSENKNIELYRAYIELILPHLYAP